MESMESIRKILYFLICQADTIAPCIHSICDLPSCLESFSDKSKLFF